MQKHKLSIEYCVQWNFTPRAVSLAAELTQNFTPSIESLTLIPSKGGCFEVKSDDQLVFSKKALGRHAQSGEVAQLLVMNFGFEPMPIED